MLIALLGHITEPVWTSNIVKLRHACVQTGRVIQYMTRTRDRVREAELIQRVSHSFQARKQRNEREALCELVWSVVTPLEA